MPKVLTALLKDALLFAHKRHLSLPYTELFKEPHLLHCNNLAKLQLQQGIVHRSSLKNNALF